MEKDEAEKRIVSEWLELAAEERATEHQATVFALKKSQQYTFRCKGDRYQSIMGWLSTHIGEP